MFTYCGNIPVNMADKSGKTFSNSYDSPAAYVGAFLGNLIYNIWNSGGKEVDSSGELTLESKLYNASKSFLNSINFRFGLGQGFYGEIDVTDEVGIGVGMYGNYINVVYDDGKWDVGQDMYVGGSVSIPFFEFEIAEYQYHFNDKNHVVEHYPWDKTEGEIDIFNLAAYFMAGGSIHIGFDISDFSNDTYRIFWG